MVKYQQLWDNMLILLKDKIGDISFNDIFKECTKVHKFENNYLYIIVPNALIKYRIEQFCINTLNELVPFVTEEKIGFKFLLKSEIELEPEQPTLKRLDEIRPVGRNLHTLYRFSNFEVGESNRYAFVTAMKVAENGVKICNPLYIFGDVGLGKTHLMTSIGNYILDNNINANVVYTSSQKFAEDYFIATSNKNSRERLEVFYSKYNTADVLLVDDIQFLEGKNATQEEFFKLFEQLATSNKQIVITSDRPASSLKNVMSRLKSRFAWGISVNINQPDKVLLINILKNKLKFLLTTPEDVSEEVLSILADAFPTNIRNLEGALRTFVNYCTCMNVPFSKENLYIALEAVLPKEAKAVDSNKYTIEVTKEVLCKYFKVSESDIDSSSRKSQVAYARQMLMYILREHFKIPLQIIGLNIGDRDHTTVAYGVDKISSMLKNDDLVKKDLEYLINNIKVE